MRFLVLTPGDPDGIGPEITWKAVQQGHSPFLCIGAKEPFVKLGAKLLEFKPELPLETSYRLYLEALKSGPTLWIYSAPLTSPSGVFLPGYQAGWSIETATRMVVHGQASALVTGPIHKERFQRGGYLFPGHTEFLAHLCRTPEVTMMLANDQLRVCLATTHLALKDVSTHLSREKIRRAVHQTVDGLTLHWKIKKPLIAVAALNPHAGESGLFGKEEIEIIHPEIQSLKAQAQDRYEIDGPLPADTLFAKMAHFPDSKKFDAVVCMYHDQGLIPVKLLDFHRTVNVTLGLPILRTSVDHGVGFDIAGKGVANPSSLIAAIELAKKLGREKT